jgi:hypothetical protein
MNRFTLKSKYGLTHEQSQGLQLTNITDIITKENNTKNNLVKVFINVLVPFDKLSITFPALLSGLGC